MADITYVAPCPSCGRDAQWRNIAAGIYVPDHGTGMRIEVRCDPCERARARRSGESDR
jgi:hypothetical protein